MLQGEDGASAAVGYASNDEHLFDALRRIDHLLHLAVLRLRTARGREPHEFQGLYIPDDEVDEILHGRRPVAPGFVPSGDPHGSLAADMADMADREAHRVAASARQGVDLRLITIATTFGLSALDTDALLLCLAPELDLRYERLYAYLQDDVTKRRPTVDLVLNLLSTSQGAKLTARKRFTADAPLMAHGLLELVDDPAQHKPPLLARYLTVETSIVDELLGGAAVDARIAPYAAWACPELGWDDLVLAPAVRDRLTAVARCLRRGAAELLVHLQGPAGVGKLTAVKAMCAHTERPLLVVSADELVAADRATFMQVVRLAARAATLRGAALYWDGVDELSPPEKRALRVALLAPPAPRPCITFLAGSSSWPVEEAPLWMSGVHVRFNPPGLADRRLLWRQALDRTDVSAAGIDLTHLAGTFSLTGGQIGSAVAAARAAALLRDPADSTVTGPDLDAAARQQSGAGLAGLALRLDSRPVWTDLVLPAEPMQQLRDVCDAARYRALVFDEWGFGRKLVLGKGLNVIFAGPSGTGKTMAAQAISGELGLDLYKIDLSLVVSKYIGETEKHLAKVFADAERGSLILFFDEADALFGQRSEVRDAHDRYANIEVSYLLQKLEDHDGIVILATNLRKNMDEAFVRRMQFAVDFPFPAEPDRRRIWENIWPSDTRLATDLDLDLLARRFELTGGNIRNIAVAAAFHAASEGSPVTMAHLLRATRREYQKLGRVTSETEFAVRGDEMALTRDTGAA